MLKKIKIFIVIFSLYTTSYGSLLVKQSIMDWIQNPGSFSILTQMLSETQCDININKILDKRTLFAPTDNAFKQFGRLGLLEGNNNIDNKKSFVNFLMLGKEISPNEATSPGNKFATLAGPEINTNQLGKVLSVLKVENGTVVVIDAVPINPNLKKLLFPDSK